MRKIPMEEYVAYEVVRNESETVWHQAKAENNYALFEPYLDKVIDYERRFARYYAPDKPVYDTLGMTTQVLDGYFAQVREKLVPLIHKVAASPVNIREDFTTRSFPIWKQRIVSDYLMDVLTIDKSHCAIGETEHPFTTEFSKYDVRITTNYKETSMASNIFSVIHEGGHALYELNMGEDLRT